MIKHHSTASVMDEMQSECFRMYTTIPHRKTVPKLFEMCKELEMGVTLRQLMRWSNQFKWPLLAKESAAALAQKVQAEMEPVLVDHAIKQLNALHMLQDRFIERMLIDPNDPNLTQAQRERAIDPDFKEFAESVKLERLILGDPTERREDVATSRVVLEFSPSELFQAAQSIAEKRYGLPPPKPVTVESE
jgi:hypothetical protein